MATPARPFNAREEDAAARAGGRAASEEILASRALLSFPRVRQDGSALTMDSARPSAIPSASPARRRAFFARWLSATSARSECQFSVLGSTNGSGVARELEKRRNVREFPLRVTPTSAVHRGGAVCRLELRKAVLLNSNRHLHQGK